jgi:hypothetical protein
MKLFFVSLSSALFLGSLGSYAQDTLRRIPTTPVAFLNFSPDARGAAMGDAGAAGSADANSTFWNAAKLAYSDTDFGGSLSYTPWLRNLTDDMFLAYLTGYYKVGKGQAVAASLNYFNNGEIDLRDADGRLLDQIVAQEFAFSGTYSRQLSRNFSMGITLRYIHSNLASDAVINNASTKPGQTAAGDISAYYKKEFSDGEPGGKSLIWSWGAVISNLGGKLSYGTSYTNFIPTNFKLGTGISYTADGKNRINFLLDANKLMVPTPPYDKELSNLKGVFGSFSDAPDGFSEELKEITLSAGAEYVYNDAFAFRLGYYNQSKMKGNQKYFTAGLGAKFQEKYSVDFAYLIPVTQGSPLAQTLRISLSFNMNKKPKNTDDDFTN